MVDNPLYSLSMVSDSSASVVNSPEKQMKIIMVGDATVGKSSLLDRYLRGEFFENMSPTIGVEYGMKSIDVDNEKIKAGIWDTSGQERFRHLTQSYYRNAQGAFLVFDVTNSLTFKSIPEWARLVNEHCVQGVVKVLVANKIDDTKRIEFSKETEHLDELMKKFNISNYFEMSAKENINVNSGFSFMIETVKRNILDTAPQEPVVVEENKNNVDNRHSNNLRPRGKSKESVRLEQNKKCC